MPQRAAMPRCCGITVLTHFGNDGVHGDPALTKDQVRTYLRDSIRNSTMAGFIATLNGTQIQRFGDVFEEEDWTQHPVGHNGGLGGRTIYIMIKSINPIAEGDVDRPRMFPGDAARVAGPIPTVRPELGARRRRDVNVQVGDIVIDEGSGVWAICTHNLGTGRFRLDRPFAGRETGREFTIGWPYWAYEPAAVVAAPAAAPVAPPPAERRHTVFVGQIVVYGDNPNHRSPVLTTEFVGNQERFTFNHSGTDRITTFVVNGMGYTIVDAPHTVTVGQSVMSRGEPIGTITNTHWHEGNEYFHVNGEINHRRVTGEAYTFGPAPAPRPAQEWNVGQHVNGAATGRERIIRAARWSPEGNLWQYQTARDGGWFSAAAFVERV